MMHYILCIKDYDTRKGITKGVVYKTSDTSFIDYTRQHVQSQFHTYFKEISTVEALVYSRGKIPRLP